MNAAWAEHKRLYPYQYAHPLVGRRVRRTDGTMHTVVRVIPSQFGLLACLDDLGAQTAYAVSSLTVVTEVTR